MVRLALVSIALCLPIAGKGQTTLALAVKANYPQLHQLSEELEALTQNAPADPALKYSACIAFSLADEQSHNLLPKLKKNFYCADFDRAKVSIGRQLLVPYVKASVTAKWDSFGGVWFPIGFAPLDEMGPPVPFELALTLLKSNSQWKYLNSPSMVKPYTGSIDTEELARRAMQVGFGAAMKGLQDKGYAIRNTRPFDPAPPLPPKPVPQ